jgi:hypothetical protein
MRTERRDRRCLGIGEAKVIARREAVVVGCVVGVRVFARGEVETRGEEGEGSVREKRDEIDERL